MFKRRVNLPDDELRALYLEQGLTMTELAARFGVGESSVRRRLNALLIPTRPRGPMGSRASAHLTLTPIELRALYIEQKLSIPQIAELYGCANETIRLRLIKYGIPIRSFSQATLIQHGTDTQLKDFDGNECEKAYMIGFRLGDLSASIPRKNSRVIFLLGGSSKAEQIELIRQVFSPFGHTTVSYEQRLSLRGLLRYEKVRVTLNNSFEFLLEHPTQVPRWILQRDDIFLAFFGGFIDAEGSFHLRTPKHSVMRGRFSIKNTDKRILEQCWEKLTSLDIRCTNLTCVYEAGRQTSKRGVFATKALWEFGVEQKESVLRLIQLLAPYLRHGKRRADMERVRQNVEWRNSNEFRQEAQRKRMQVKEGKSQIDK